jgi:hypothetical protein
MSVKVRSTNPSEPNIVHSAHSIPLPIWRDLSWLSLLNHFHKFVVVGALLCSACFALLCFALLALLCSLCSHRSHHSHLRASREKVLLKHHAELFPNALQLLEVLVVLALVLDLCVDTCCCCVSALLAAVIWVFRVFPASPGSIGETYPRIS